MADKNTIMIHYLLNCPQISENPLFFNFAQAEDENRLFVTMSDDTNLNISYIDGSVLKRFTFTIIVYKSVTYQQVPRLPNYSSENVEDYVDVQSIIDWISEQNDKQNFPDFGEDCIIDKIEALSLQPNLNGVDTSLTPPLAKYSIAIRTTYLDISKRYWR